MSYQVLNMVALAEWFMHTTVDRVYMSSNLIRYPSMKEGLIVARQFVLPWLVVFVGLIGIALQAHSPTSTLGFVLTRSSLMLTVCAFVMLELTERAKGQEAICKQIKELQIKVDNATLICYYGGRADGSLVDNGDVVE